MIELSLARIAEIVGGRLADVSAEDAAATMVTGTVEFDSRAVTPGGLFLALPGSRTVTLSTASGLSTTWTWSGASPAVPTTSSWPS
ncbi:hypothetical protein ASJ79_29970 [Mycobacterium sp. NAZ190054]|nr:hypothetical protein ASJ79_29970 [Mycobacterium sp. NAZ190054]